MLRGSIYRSLARALLPAIDQMVVSLYVPTD